MWRNAIIFKVLALVAFCLLSCKEVNVKEGYTNGRVVNRLEDGNWIYKSKDNSGDTIKAGTYIRGLKTDKWNYLFKDSLVVIDWKVFKNETHKLVLNYPSYFNIKANSRFPFFATVHKGEYFVIQYVPKEMGVETTKDYVKEVFKTMLADNTERLTGYNIHGVDFQQRGYTYQGEFYVEGKGANYVSFICYVKDRNNNVVDITLKTLDENLEIKKAIFNDIVYSIFIDEEKLFYIDDYVDSNSLINLDSL